MVTGSESKTAFSRTVRVLALLGTPYVAYVFSPTHITPVWTFVGIRVLMGTGRPRICTLVPYQGQQKRSIFV